MALATSPLFPATEVTTMLVAHAEYARIKENMFAKIGKMTTGKTNTKDDGIASARKWYAFMEENPDWTTNVLKLSEFLAILDAAELLTIIELMESKDQGVTKVAHDIISSDARFCWTTAEDFYIAAAAKNATIKEKYKDLPSISPKRKTDAQIQAAFDKLEVKRAKKKGNSTPPKAE